MALSATDHPTPQQLEQFLRGQLAPADLGSVEAHLLACPACAAALNAAAGDADPFLDRLKSAYTDKGGDTSVIETAQRDTGVLHDGSQLLIPTRGDDYGTIVAPAEALPLSGAAGAKPPSPATGAGQLFGDYELVEFIASGGMGVVYKARQRSLNRVVALKMIRGDMLGTEQAIQRFYQEARAAAALDHPNIVPIYEIGEQQGNHFFTMAFVQGTRLSERVAPGKPLTAHEAVELMLPIVDAVGFAHKHGIIHRDLKPDNVLLDAQGRPRVTDFGLAKHVEGDAGLTSPGTILGTPEYMAPEQALGREQKIGPATDVYALGGVLYFLLTGRPPFQGGSTTEVLSKLLVEAPTSPRSLNGEVPAPLSAICERCLAKEPSQRFANAEALRQALHHYASAGTPTAIIADARPFPPGGDRSSIRRALVFGLVGLGLAIAALATWQPWRGAGDPGDPNAAIVPGPGPVAKAPEKAAGTPALVPVKFEWPTVKHRDFPLKVEIVGARQDKDGVYQLTEGDPITLRIEPASDAYVGVWTMDGKGDVLQVFPNGYEKFNRLARGVARTVPGEDVKDYWIHATPSEGVERVRVIASSKPWEMPEGKKEGPYVVFDELDSRTRLATMMRGMELKKANSQKDAVAEAELRFFVSPAK